MMTTNGKIPESTYKEETCQSCLRDHPTQPNFYQLFRNLQYLIKINLHWFS